MWKRLPWKPGRKVNKRIDIKDWLILGVISGLFAALLSSRLWEIFLHFLFPGENQVLYPNASLSLLVSQHLALVALSSAITLAIGIPLGIWATRQAGKDFLPLITAVSSFGQTFPPMAVLALAVPVLGFGLLPTVVALYLYGLLPVVRNTIAGINAVPQSFMEAAAGMGMGRGQMLLQIELPLASGLILAGVRILSDH